MATREDYEKRLMSAAVRVVRAEDGYTISATDNLPGAIKELAAILAEQDARIEEVVRERNQLRGELENLHADRRGENVGRE